MSSRESKRLPRQRVEWVQYEQGRGERSPHSAEEVDDGLVWLNLGHMKRHGGDKEGKWARAALEDADLCVKALTCQEQPG